MKTWFNLAGHPAETVLQAYANGELEGRARRHVFRHVSICPSCRDTVQTDRELLRFLTSVDPGSAALANTRQKLFERIQSESSGAVATRMRQEMAGLLGKAAADRLVGMPGSLPPAVETQLVALLGTRAATRFHERWAAAA